MSDISEKRERWQEATDYHRSQRDRMREDLEFSNPADPQQWSAEARAERENAVGGARPCITEDFTNQYIAQVENDGRQNKPGIEVSPGDSQGSKQAALVIEGHIRQIEYASRADIAYARSLSHASRCGLGWLRVGTKMVNPALNEQEIVILSIADPLTAMIDEDSTEPDGADAAEAWVEGEMTKRAFEKEYGKNHSSWGESSTSDKTIRLCENFYLVKTSARYLSIQMPDGTNRQILFEDLQKEQQQAGRVQVMADYQLETNQAKWCKLSGSDILDEADFPSQYIPLVPVYGHELWIAGKRYICGLTRQLMDSQRLNNYERSSWVEVIGKQPQVPWIVAAESIEGAGMKAQWAEANRSNKPYITFNALDVNGQPLPPPQRLAPPTSPTAFAQGSSMAREGAQGNVGMYRSNFGAQSNAVSGRAKLADQREGDTATYHYQDNRARSIAHLGRIVVDMLPRVKDTKRDIRSMSPNGQAKIVQVDPDAQQAYQDGKTGPVVNLNIGRYEVRCKTGPAYNSLAEEASQNLTELLGKAPDLLPVIGPYWARMQKGPESEHLSKLLLTMATPAVQALENQDTKIPPEVQPMVTAMQQQIQQMQQAGQQMMAQMQQMQQALNEKQTQTQIDMATAETKSHMDELAMQIKQGEFQLKARELDLREREMALKEFEAQNKPEAVQTDTSAIDAGNLQINARKVEIDAFSAETARLKVELDALAAKFSADVQAAEAIRAAQAPVGQDQPAVANPGAADIAAKLAQFEIAIQALMAPRKKTGAAVKGPDGVWRLETIEQTIAPEQMEAEPAGMLESTEIDSTGE